MRETSMRGTIKWKVTKNHRTNSRRVKITRVAIPRESTRNFSNRYRAEYRKKKKKRNY